MGAASSASPSSYYLGLSLQPSHSGVSKSHSISSLTYSTINKKSIFQRHCVDFFDMKSRLSSNPFSSSAAPLDCSETDAIESQPIHSLTPMSEVHDFDQELIERMVYDALVWCSLHGLVVGDKAAERSGKVPGVGLVHAPFALLPMLFPESHWKQACEVAPLFNELVDRVSLDGKFLQESLSKTKKADAFTSRLLDIHSKMLQINKKEEIRLGLHRSDYMLDEKTKLLLQIELNTISSSFPGLSCRVSELHRNLLTHYGECLGLDPKNVPSNSAVSHFAESLAKAWIEYNKPRSVVMIVVQSEERNMYDQHWLSTFLRERCQLPTHDHDVFVRDNFKAVTISSPSELDVPMGHTSNNINTLRKTLADIDNKGELLADGTLVVSGQQIAVVYFRAGYTPSDYPSEAEWRARLLVEQSSAIKCPSVSYHLAGTKKIQQELAKPNVLERFVDKEDDIAKLRRCFAGLWSLDDSDIVRKAIKMPESFVMKPQREGGGNNIYGNDVRETLLRLQKGGSEENAAYILMQRIFPTLSPAFLIRDGVCHKDYAISELGIYSAYLRNKEKVIVNEPSGYLMRTKISSSNEGGVAAGFAVLDSLYLT